VEGGEAVTNESPLIPPVAVQYDKAVIIPAHEAPAPEQAIALPDAEQTRAVEAIFAAQERESKTVMGLLGMWTGSMLLHDMAVETFSEPVDECERDATKKKPKLPRP
jgi:hypothetical protein